MVTIRNDSRVPEAEVSKIVAAACLPEGDILVALAPSGFPAAEQALSICRHLLRYTRNSTGLDQYVDEPWACAVAVSRKWCDLQTNVPAYFAYLVAHELGHCATCLLDCEAVTYEDVVKRTAERVTGGRIRSQGDLPHELLYDQFGLFVALELYGRERLELDVETIVTQNLTADVNRVRRLTALEPTRELESRRLLREFALPDKEAYLALWEEEAAKPIVTIFRRLRKMQPLF